MRRGPGPRGDVRPWQVDGRSANLEDDTDEGNPVTTTAGASGVSVTYSAPGPGAHNAIRLMFGPEIADHDIERALRDAVEDLRSSVSRESLLEMAVRLAVVRLDRETHSRGRQQPVSFT